MLRKLLLLLLLAMLPISVEAAQEIHGYKERRFGDDITNFKCDNTINWAGRLYGSRKNRDIFTYEMEISPAGQHVIKDIKRCNSLIESELQINGSKVNVEYTFYKNKLVKVYIYPNNKSDYPKIVDAFIAKYGKSHVGDDKSMYFWSDYIDNHIWINIGNNSISENIRIIGKGYSQIYADYKLHVSKDL
jgi:hypothetical protein